MKALYPSGYKPLGIRSEWDRSSMQTSGEGQAGDILRRHSVPDRYGDPTEAVAWFDGNGALRAMVADYANGRRAELRVTKRGSRLSLTSPGDAS